MPKPKPKAKEEPKRGRPTVEDADRRSIMIRVLATADEHADLQAGAKKAGMPISTWLRVTALEKVRT